MSGLTVAAGRPLRGTVSLPGDKSITHRALLLGALAAGTTYVRGALLEGDCVATLECLRAMGIAIEIAGGTELRVAGGGLRGLAAPAAPLNCRRSGTTMRLLAGILAGQSFASVLSGEEQLRRRPMGRIVAPLRQMGAQITAEDDRAPLRIAAGALHGIDYTLPVASAQVKSAILLAGLFAAGLTTVREPAATRDHTERMLRAMGAELTDGAGTVTITPAPCLQAVDITVPGDISSAAFLMVAGSIVPGSDLVIREVGLNPTRDGVLEVLRQMGADIEVLDERVAGGEPVGDIRVRAAALHGTEIGGALIPRLIDELPVLAVAATQAEGVTVIRDAAELRVKETDRVEATVTQLRRLGAHIEARPDGMVVEGPCRLAGAPATGGQDHRIAMALVVAGLVAAGETMVQDVDFISDSYPGFLETLAALGAGLR